ERKLKSTLIKVDDAYKAFTSLLSRYNGKNNNKIGVSPLAYIADSAKIGAGCYVGAFAYIGENVTIGDHSKIFSGCYVGDNVSIGEESILYSGVKVYEKCIVGNHCIIHANVVLGADGFGFTADAEKQRQKIHHIGNV